MVNFVETVKMFGLNICKGGFNSAVSILESALDSQCDHAKVVVTPNVDHIVRLQKNPQLYESYRSADIIFPDGFPIVLSAKLLGKEIEERVTGADLFPAICRILAKRAGKIFALGGHPGTESLTKERLTDKYQGLKVEAYAPPFGFSHNSEEADMAVRLINSYQPDVVFVCLGMPKQEMWSFKYRRELNTKLILCVGAALEFDLGLIRRAPKWIQTLNSEWLWRLCSNPRRLWKRYLIDDIAFLRILYAESKLQRYSKYHTALGDESSDTPKK